MSNPIVTFEMADGGIFKAELYPELAPESAGNFISLVKSGFYDGLIFHRVIKGFMIQGGDPTGTGMGGPGYHIKGEFKMNGFINNIKHERGVLSMARSMMPDSAGSQFFVMHENAPHLDGSYAAFGRVIEGMEVVDKIAETKTDYSDRPVKEQKMKKVTVEDGGREYPFKKLKNMAGTARHSSIFLASPLGKLSSEARLMRSSPFYPPIKNGRARKIPCCGRYFISCSSPSHNFLMTLMESSFLRPSSME